MRSMDDLLLHLVFMAQNFQSFSRRHIVEIFLLEIGVLSKKDSFNYLVDSILLHDDSEYSLITKVVFPEVAKKYGLETKAMEKAIERAIRCAWINRDENWNMYFLNDECVTSAEFISRMAKILGFWQDCCKSVSQKEGSKCRD